MIQKHENQIMNYFINPQTNAKAERLNGKIQRFLSNSYETRDLDFTLYRLKWVFSIAPQKKELTKKSMNLL